MPRIAILDRERCKPEDCGRECMRFCPEVRGGIEAVKFPGGEGSQPLIAEALCSGCGICVKKCPFKAISIINLPERLEGECAHRYGPNSFELLRLPEPSEGAITGLIGRNGMGKSTALRILSGELKPNLGDYESPPDWDQIIKRFRGSVLQEYFRKLSGGELKVIRKPQYVDGIRAVVKGRVREVLEGLDEANRLSRIKDELHLGPIYERDVKDLSGGELQRLAIAAALIREADVYIFDEPSSHLDVYQRLEAAKGIRMLAEEGRTVLLAEHDLAMLDYLSDQVCILYGEPGAYGIVSHPKGVRNGINIYLGGYMPDENMRFRDESIKFSPKPPRRAEDLDIPYLQWPRLVKDYGQFRLEVSPGRIFQGEVLGLMGPNGIGKTTFIELLAGLERADVGSSLEGYELSLKPQYISGLYEGIVGELIKGALGADPLNLPEAAELVRSLGLDGLMERRAENLSGGELQRLAIAICLLKDAQIYLLDEPCAYLDIEERFSVAKVIKRRVMEKKAFGFVVEHDIILQDLLADRLMVFLGRPGEEGFAGEPQALKDGMNSFLKDLGVTFRRDPDTGRPRVNKPGSRLDRIQRGSGEYYYA
ncbi:MAG: ribosome biogenesis/translation initiation ATPase RLI [Candidatus Bathyarchaeia archaeon]